MHTFRKHLFTEIFVIATGFAALVHSTWSVGTLFSGMQPLVASGEDATAYAFRYASWVLPALLIAFALDIGQIATSHEIRQCILRGEQPVRKYVTFVIFALATYYLQWLYMAYHIPMLALGEGVSAMHIPVAQALRDMAVWIVPVFLPLSTLLYTFSHVQTESAHGDEAPRMQASAVIVVHEDSHPKAPAIAPVHKPITVRRVHSSAAGSYTGETKDALVQAKDGTWSYVCPHCNEGKGAYASEGAARNACSTHVGRWCKVRQQMQLAHPNGNGHHGQEQSE